MKYPTFAGANWEYAFGMSDFVSEDDCSLCGRMWRSERKDFRRNLEMLPLQEPVCDRCLMAFCRNIIGLPVRDHPTEH